jgi:uncharacterized protein (TIGR02145 family)
MKSSINLVGLICLILATNLHSCKKEEQATLIDADGNVYRSLTIGTQVWMVENMKTTKYNDGTPIPIVTNNGDWENLTTGAYCWYDNNAATYKDTYGALYNWYAVSTGKLCPTDWHVPSDAEWTLVEAYLIANNYNYDGTTSGNKYAKSLCGTTLWGLSIIEGAAGNTDFPSYRNKTGYTALPSGDRYSDGTFHTIGFAGYWWTATEFSATDGWYRSIGYNNSDVARGNFSKKDGFSIRCIKD